MSDILDAFIARFHRDGWIAAGPPSAGVAIAMVNEIARLRAEVAALRVRVADLEDPAGIGLGERGA